MVGRGKTGGKIRGDKELMSKLGDNLGCGCIYKASKGSVVCRPPLLVLGRAISPKNVSIGWGIAILFLYIYI